jgi:hypothetical protein
MKKCFVILPFSKTKENHSEDYWKRHFYSYLKPLIENIGEFEVSRSEPLRGDIATQIITDLANADVVVADLTDHNSNVLWELGVRQSFKQCTITIAETGTLIPFHFSHKGILFYNGEHLENQEFESKFIQALKNCSAYPNQPDSPVLEALGGRGTLYSIIHKEENERRISALKMESQHNQRLFRSAIINSKKNEALRLKQKDKTTIAEVHMITSLLGTLAADFLLINRYLDIDEASYEIIRRYCQHLHAVNNILADWLHHSQRVDKWLLNCKPTRKVFSEYEELIKKL